jgi:hypothetical protein
VVTAGVLEDEVVVAVILGLVDPNHVGGDAELVYSNGERVPGSGEGFGCATNDAIVVD